MRVGISSKLFWFLVYYFCKNPRKENQMEPVAFFNERTPLSGVSESIVRCERVKKVIAVALFTFISFIALFSIYDGTRTLLARPLKNSDFGWSIYQVAFGFLCAMGLSGATGYSIAKYQNAIESYHHNAYQGSFAETLTSLIDRPDLDDWKPVVSSFLDHFEPVLLDKYFLQKEVPLEQRTNHLLEKLKKGCCFGYSMAFLAKMKEGAKLSSKELKESIKFENVIYYQLVNNILWKLNSSISNRLLKNAFGVYRKTKWQGSFSDFLKENDLHGNIDVDKFLMAMMSYCKANGIGVDDFTNDLKNSVNYRRLFLDYCNLLSEDVLFYESDLIKNFENSQKPKEVLLTLFQNAETSISSQSQTSTLVGYVSVHHTNPDEKRSGHALFFQISDGFFRFTDSGAFLQHFFEFDSKEDMIEGLASHLKKAYGKDKDVSVSIILLGITPSL